MRGTSETCRFCFLLSEASSGAAHEIQQHTTDRAVGTPRRSWVHGSGICSLGCSPSSSTAGLVREPTMVSYEAPDTCDLGHSSWVGTLALGPASEGDAGGVLRGQRWQLPKQILPTGCCGPFCSSSCAN